MKIIYDDYTYFDPNINENLGYYKHGSSEYWSYPKIKADNGQYLYDYTTEAQQKNNAKGNRRLDSKWDPATYRFDSQHFNKLIANRQFEDAANYASKYHFNDPRVQRQHENDVINLRRQGRRVSAVYGSINNQDDLERIEFIDAVFMDNGLEAISNNSYAKQFIDAKRSIGSKLKPDGTIEDEAVALSLTFAPKKREFLGIDFLAGDNNYNNIEAFYERSGLNEPQLKSAGIELEHRDGSTTIKFDKTNKLANKIIMDAISEKAGPLNMQSNGDLLIVAGGLTIKGYTADGKVIDYSYNNDNTNVLYNLVDLIYDSEAIKTDKLQELSLTTKDYSSTIGPALDDNMEALNKALSENRITEQEYNKQIKLAGNIVDQAIRTLGSGNYKMYSNIYNDDPLDETLIELENTQRSEIIQSISAAPSKNLHFNAMIANGEIGTLVTIDATESDDAKKTDSNEVTRRRRQVFIPGLMYRLAQDKINRNTSTRAIQEINDMQTFGYGFTTSNGQEIYADPNGKFYIDGEEISKDKAIKQINKSMIIEDATTNLKYNFTNNKGEIYDAEGYETVARKLAIKAANELNPNIPFDTDDIDEIFIKKGAGTDVNEDYADNLQYELYDKYLDVFEIYDKLIAELYNY